MTTIAFRAGIFAADSREFDGEAMALTEKLFRVKVRKSRREAIIATAGGTYLGMVFVDWYKRTGGTGDAPAILAQANLEEDFEVLVWDRGKLHAANHLCRLVPILDAFTAIGSGCAAALAAMHCGRSAYAAVQIAAKIDPYTGPPVRTMRVR